MPTLFDLRSRKCRNCGKKFDAAPEWAYKEEKWHGKYWWYCSWHCLQEYRSSRDVRHYRSMKR